MLRNFIFTTICTMIATCVLTANTNAQIVFSNDFEDGDLLAEVGSMTLVADSATPSIVSAAVAPDATLGNNVVLLDQNTLALDLTLNLINPVSLEDGNTVSIDFDVAARRTTGLSKTIYVDAMDSNGNIVSRFVLGDNNAFGNLGNDRQRPGFATLAGGNMIFGTPPGSFWWGSDATTVDFDVNKDAHVSLTIGAASWDLSTTGQGIAGVAFNVTGVSNYDVVTSTNIAEVKLTSIGANYGAYFDNITVDGVMFEVPTGLLGDVDMNGVVNFLDISPFIAVLSSGDFKFEADVDSNGIVNFLDISPFIAILSGS